MRAIRPTELSGQIERLGPRALLAACFTRQDHAPSQALLAALEAMPDEIAGRVESVKIDIDADAGADAETIDELRIFKVPELILFGADGRIVERTEGEMNAEQVAELFTYVLDGMMP